MHKANIQDPYGAVPPLRSLRHAFPELAHVFADRVYRGPQLREVIADAARDDRNRRASPRCQGFQLLPRRWVVEGTLA